MVWTFQQGKTFGSGTLLNTSIIQIWYQMYSGVKKYDIYGSHKWRIKLNKTFSVTSQSMQLNNSMSTYYLLGLLVQCKAGQGDLPEEQYKMLGEGED